MRESILQPAAWADELLFLTYSSLWLPSEHLTHVVSFNYFSCSLFPQTRPLYCRHLPPPSRASLTVCLFCHLASTVTGRRDLCRVGLHPTSLLVLQNDMTVSISLRNHRLTKPFHLWSRFPLARHHGPRRAKEPAARRGFHCGLLPVRSRGLAWKAQGPEQVGRNRRQEWKGFARRGSRSCILYWPS